MKIYLCALIYRLRGKKPLKFQILIKELAVLTCLIFLEDIWKRFISFVCLFVFYIQLPANVSVLHASVFEIQRKKDGKRKRVRDY